MNHPILLGVVYALIAILFGFGMVWLASPSEEELWLIRCSNACYSRGSGETPYSSPKNGCACADGYIMYPPGRKE